MAKFKFSRKHNKLEKVLETRKELPFVSPQRQLDYKVKNNQIIVQCAVTGLFRLKGEWVGYNPGDYKNISHTYCEDAYDNIMYVLENEK